MKLRQVEHFLAVAHNGTLRWAAQSLSLTQAALSKSIKSLERDLGADLFERSGQGMALTGAGRALLGPATSMMRSAEEARSRGRPGLLTLASWGTLSVDPIAGLVARVRSASPDLEVRIHQATEEADVPELVREGQCELGVMFVPGQTWGLETVPIGDVDQCLILPPGTEPPAEDPLPFAAISRYPLVVVSGGVQSALLVDAVARAGIRVRYAAVCDHREALISLVLAGVGAGIASAGYAARAESRGAVVRRFESAMARSRVIVHRRESLSDPAQRFLLEAAHLR